jgi:hypothetical protein
MYNAGITTFTHSNFHHERMFYDKILKDIIEKKVNYTIHQSLLAYAKEVFVCEVSAFFI